MSYLIINIRIYIYHLQVNNNYKFTISKNDYHKNNKKTPFFAVYKFYNYKK